MSKINKVVYGNEVLIDLTGDTVTPDKLAKGFTAHDKSGEVITGENTYDADTQDATAAVAEILKDRTAYVRGNKLTGTMPNNGSQTSTINAKDGSVAIKQGYHDGSGSVTIDPTEKVKLIPDNIRQGITILGVVGEMSGLEEVKAEAKTVIPSAIEQVITPSNGYNYLSQVTVEAIPYVESDNAAGGKTVTIG